MKIRSLLPTGLAVAAAAVAIAAALMSTHARAQFGGEVAPEIPSDSWKFSAGLGAASGPLYPGSSERKTRALPVISAGYGRYFIGGVPGAGIPAGIGAFLVQDSHWRLGVGLGGNFEKPRKESDSVRLRGLGDIDRTALGSVFGSYTEEWFSATAGVLTDIGGKHQGTRIALDFEGKYRLMDRLVVSAGPGVTWADSNYTQTFFGIDATQSARSGLSPYTPKSGINSIRFGVGADYRLTERWGIGARLTAASLRGDAARSPITEKKAQNSFGAFAAYRF